MDLCLGFPFFYDCKAISCAPLERLCAALQSQVGAVEHPDEWEHCAIRELLGKRERYRIINMQRLLQCLDIGTEKAFRTWYLKALDEKLTCISYNREGYWSEAIAVGDPDWLESAAREAGIKRYTVQNDRNAYIDFMTGKN